MYKRCHGYSCGIKWKIYYILYSVEDITYTEHSHTWIIIELLYQSRTFLLMRFMKIDVFFFSFGIRNKILVVYFFFNIYSLVFSIYFKYPRHIHPTKYCIWFLWTFINEISYPGAKQEYLLWLFWISIMIHNNYSRSAVMLCSGFHFFIPFVLSSFSTRGFDFFFFFFSSQYNISHIVDANEWVFHTNWTHSKCVGVSVWKADLNFK